jgi:hypothetical protein
MTSQVQIAAKVEQTKTNGGSQRHHAHLSARQAPRQKARIDLVWIDPNFGGGSTFGGLTAWHAMSSGRWPTHGLASQGSVVVVGDARGRPLDYLEPD